MGINVCLPVIAALAFALADCADYPDYPHQMVNMFMGNKYFVDVHTMVPCIFQLAQNHIPTASIHHEMFVVIAYQKACIIAFRHHRTSCP